MSRLTRTAGAIASGVLALGMLAGCGGSSPSAGHSSSAAANPSTGTSTPPAPTGPAATGPAATTPPAAGLARFYGQKLTWSSCRSDDECSELTVPLDYRHPDGATIKLALLRVPAADKSERIGSLVVNPGGPGGSGLDYAASASQAFRAPLRDHYDIVGFDPRGVGHSDPIDCLSDRQLDDYIAQDPDPDTPAEVKTYASWNATMATGCAKSPVGAHISTVDAARDMDVLRAALGEGKLTYFGASYGTKLGTTYADLFPDRVGRFVLDGAVDPTLDNEQTALQQGAGFETALRAYVQSCLDDGSQPCYLGSTMDAALARIKALLDRVDAHPLPASGGRQLDAGNAFYGIALPLYDRDYWVLLTQALQQAFNGDGSTLLQLSDAYTSRAEKGYSDNSMEALYDISCLDDSSSIPTDKVASVLPEFEKAAPTFGKVFAWGLTSCSDFKQKADQKAPPIGAPGADPIVVVGTTRDPATPLQWAQHLAKLLKSGVLVTRDGDGHTGYNTGNTCVNDAVEGYLVDGTVPENGLSC